MATKLRTLFKMLRLLKNPHTYLSGYLGLRKGILTYKLRNGVRYKIRANATDRFIVNEIWLHESYNPKGFEIKKGDVVVDIGAHIGIFTLYAAHHAKNGKIYSFEPAEDNFRLLKENIRINNFRNVEVFNKAVGGKKGKLIFFVSQTRNKGQNSMYKLGESQKEITVDKISFRDFLKKLEKIDFLKMDCEGAEYDILLSLNKTELNKIKKISMEYHNYEGRSGEEIREFLEKKGFRVVLNKGGGQFGGIYATNKESQN